MVSVNSTPMAKVTTRGYNDGGVKLDSENAAVAGTRGDGSPSRSRSGKEN